MSDPPRAHIRIAFDGFELDLDGPVDDVRDVLAVLTDRLVAAFGKAKEAVPAIRGQGMSDYSLMAATLWLQKFDASLIVIPRAQHEALMAAARRLQPFVDHFITLPETHNGEIQQGARDDLAALRAAGIQTEGE